MRVYVAGSSRDLDHVKQVQGLVKDSGHEITYNWVPDVERHGVGGHGPRHAEYCAHMDWQGVKSADLVIAVAHHQMWGAMLEIGMAIALYTHVWICEEWEAIRYSVFFELPTVFPGLSFRRVQEALNGPVLGLQERQVH